MEHYNNKLSSIIERDKLAKRKLTNKTKTREEKKQYTRLASVNMDKIELD